MQLITFEGIDGAGKSVVIQQLTQSLPALFTHDSPALRCRIAEAETVSQQYALIMGGRMLTHLMLGEVFKKASDKNYPVLYDRYVHSTLVYQGGDEITAERIWDDHDACGFIRPALTILLDIPADVAVERLSQKNRDAIERNPASYFGALRQKYLDLAFESPGSIAIVDATQPLNTVVALCRELIKGRLHGNDHIDFDVSIHDPATHGGIA
jgi:dTMP kinase